MPASNRVLFLKAHPATSPEPTPAQAASGNYKKRAMQWQGLTIRIENEAGSYRRGRSRDGKEWEVRMVFPYGEIARTEGVDGDPVDVIVGPYLDAPMVYVVHQRRYGDWGKYDEDKCCIGFDSEESATAAFLANYNDPRFLGPVTAMPVAEFVAKVKATRKAPAMIKAVQMITRKDGVAQRYHVADKPEPKHEQKLADDMEAQMAWLEEQAVEMGYAGIEDLVARNYPAFEALATKWRDDHPVEVALKSFADAMLKARVGPYIRRGKLVNLSGYDGRQARAAKAPGQGSLFAELEVREASARKVADMARHDHTKTADLFEGKPAARVKQTETRAFKEWFGNSKVRDENGEPLRMYHITPHDFDTFHPGGKEALDGHPEGQSGRAIWFSPFKDDQPAAHNTNPGLKARREGAKYREGTNVMPVFLRIERPLMIDDKEMLEWARQVFAEDSGEFPQIVLRKWRDEIVKEGYDGIIFRGDAIGWGERAIEYIVFDPNQIKSAIGNNGDFSKDSPVITKSETPPSVLFVKSHISAYTKKDGTFVAAHEDKRVASPHADPMHSDRFQVSRTPTGAGMVTGDEGVMYFVKPDGDGVKLVHRPLDHKSKIKEFEIFAGSVDEAVSQADKRLRRAYASLKGTAKYARIPQTWDGDAKRAAKALIDAGYAVSFGQSTQSKSKYITVETDAGDVKVRLSDHDLPSSYDAPDVDFRYGSDVKDLVRLVAEFVAKVRATKENPKMIKSPAGECRVLFLKTHVRGYVNSKGTFVAAHEDSRITHPSEDRGWFGADVADAIRDHMESDPYADFGLRVVPRGFEVDVGDELPPSKRWEDGEDTGEELRGTSTIGVRKDDVERAIKTLERGGYSGSQVVLVAGDSVGAGEDEGERLIRNAKVVAVWKKAPKLAKSLPILFIKAKHRGDDRTIDMFGTHLEVRTRKDGKVQGYHVSNAKKDAALDAAISHLKEDAKQADMPAHERKEDKALVAKLEEARGGTGNDTAARRKAALAVLGDDWRSTPDGKKDAYKRSVKLADGGRYEVMIKPARTVAGNFYVGSYFHGGKRSGPGNAVDHPKTLEEAKAVADSWISKLEAAPTQAPAEDLEKFIKVAADSIGQLRKVDVLRVLESNGSRKVELANYITDKRPDLAQEVKEVMEEEFGIKDWAATKVAKVEPAKPDPETELRALWTKQGVSKERQDELIRQIGEKAKPGADVGPFKIAPLKRDEVTAEKLKQLIGNNLGLHEFPVEGGAKVKAEVKITTRGGVIRTKYLHITTVEPSGKWEYYREQPNGAFKLVSSGRGADPRMSQPSGESATKMAKSLSYNAPRVASVHRVR